jgi:D-tyrosyl-tRNA(Tyr) deacylase
VQRVSRARILIGGKEQCSIGKGLFVLLGLGKEDTEEDLVYLVNKIVNLRVFEDSEGKMNLSVVDVGGSIACVSQFTLFGETRKGNRPSFSEAMAVARASSFWQKVVDAFTKTKVHCVFGVFQAMMQCELTNDGPVTIIIDSIDKLRPRRG